jgi:hypothetical protein
VGRAQHHAAGGLAECRLLRAVGGGVAGDCPGAASAPPTGGPNDRRRFSGLGRDPRPPRGRNSSRRRTPPVRTQADRQRPSDRRSPLEAWPAVPATARRKTLTRTRWGRFGAVSKPHWRSSTASNLE